MNAAEPAPSGNIDPLAQGLEETEIVRLSMYPMSVAALVAGKVSKKTCARRARILAPLQPTVGPAKRYAGIDQPISHSN